MRRFVGSPPGGHAVPTLPESPRSTAVRIERMLELARPPHGYHGSAGFLDVHPVGAFSKRIRIALEHHECSGARRMRCGEQRRWRQRAVDREKDRFAAPEMAGVGPDCVKRPRTEIKFRNS